MQEDKKIKRVRLTLQVDDNLVRQMKVRAFYAGTSLTKLTEQLYQTFLETTSKTKRGK